MPRFLTADYKCQNEECGHFEILLLDLSDINDIEQDGKPRSIRRCPICEQESFHKQLKMPMNTRASFVDGTKRKGFADMRESAKLKREAAVSPREKRKEIEREIRKMGVKGNKDGI